MAEAPWLAVWGRAKGATLPLPPSKDTLQLQAAQAARLSPACWSCWAPTRGGFGAAPRLSAQQEGNRGLSPERQQA